MKNLSEAAKNEIKSRLSNVNWQRAIEEVEIGEYDDNRLSVKLELRDNFSQHQFTLEEITIEKVSLRTYLIEDMAIQLAAEKEKEFNEFFSHKSWAFHKNKEMIGRLVVKAMVNWGDGVENPCLEALIEILPDYHTISEHT